MLYAQDGPPGPVAVMLFRGVIQAGVLLAAYTWATRGISGNDSQDGSGTQQEQHQQQEQQQQQQQQPASSSSLVPAWVADLASKVPFTAIAASELGLWLFLATGIQVRPHHPMRICLLCMQQRAAAQAASSPAGVAHHCTLGLAHLMQCVSKSRPPCMFISCLRRPWACS